MWLHNERTGATVLVLHHDTIQRCLDDGWAEVPNPTIRVTPEPAPVSAPVPVRPQPQPQPAAVRKGRR